MTQRDVMGRDAGGGFKMGNMCTPVADACWCMAKPIQYCKVKKKNNNNNKKTISPWKKSYGKSGQCIKKQRHHFADKVPYSQNYGFSSSHVWRWELDHTEGWSPRTDAFELWCWIRHLIVPWTARRLMQSILKKSTLKILWKDWCWSWNSNTLATWCEELTYWKRSRCWERSRAGEGGNKGWGVWMASSNQRTWMWANSRQYWRTEKCGLLQFMGSQSWTLLSKWTTTDSMQFLSKY